MAYVEPNSTIWLCSVEQSDKDYEHTILFPDKTAQFNYYLGKVYTIPSQQFILTPATYQRESSNSIKVPWHKKWLLPVNYMMFKNETDGKIYYAFVLSAEYVNENCSVIYYEIDDMQTWLFDHKLGECLVDRETVLDDTIGKNLTNEALQGGDIVYDLLSKGDWLTSYKLVIGTTLSLDTLTASFNPQIGYGYTIHEHATGIRVANTYSSMHYYACDLPTGDESEEMIPATSAIEWIIRAVNKLNKTDEIFTIFSYPSAMLNLDEPTLIPTNGGALAPQYNIYKVKTNVGTGTVVSDRLLPSPNFTDIDGYVPKNNKMFTYPYYYMKMKCGDSDVDYKYERFDSTLRFRFYGAVTEGSPILVSPYKYNGVEYAPFESFTISDFPKSNWLYDYYENWSAQNQGRLAISGISSIINTYMGMQMGFAQQGVISQLASNSKARIPAGAEGGSAQKARITKLANARMETVATGQAQRAAGGVTDALGILGESMTAQATPNQLRGSITGSLTEIGNSFKTYYQLNAHITKEFAKKIDDYFSMYGYKIGDVKIPNIEKYKHQQTQLRPRWNYIKTVNAHIHAAVDGAKAVPCEAAENLANIYNHGITFWFPNTIDDGYLDTNGNMRNNKN